MKNVTWLSRLGKRTEAPAISWMMDIALARPKLVSLAAGFTDNESLPVSETSELIHKLLKSPKTGQPSLQYGTTEGDPRLRKLTADYLCKSDGAKAGGDAYSPDRMVLTSGSQQMLYMVTEALCDEGDIVIVEDPSYFVYLGILQSHGLRARTVRLQEDGIDLEHLETVLERLKKEGQLHRVKMLYLVTYYQNPTGVNTRFEKKVAALKLLRRYEKAAGHPIYLLEDAAYRELRFKGADEKSALSIPGADKRVIYAGTYSKPFASGIRIGFGILPEPLRTVVVRIKGNHDFGSANLLQQIISRVMDTDVYENHLTHLRARYARKAGVMLKAIKEHFPSQVEYMIPQGGLYFWARLPKGMDCDHGSKFFKAAIERDVLYVPGSLCYATDPTRRKPNNTMRISFGGSKLANIPEGIKRLGSVMHEWL